MLYLRWLLILTVVVVCAAFLGSRPILTDTYWHDVPAIIFGNDKLELTIDKLTGEWISLLDKSMPGNLLRPGKAYSAIDVCVAADTKGRSRILSVAVDMILTAYRKMAAVTMPLDLKTPDWVKKQIILEVYPPYYKGGLTELTARLPFYQSIGFTLIYLMPHWQGGYRPINLYRIDPRFGTPTDLKSLVKTAHALGMKVIFDMVIHGFNEKSMVPQQHPDLFVHNEQGQLALHPTWKSITTDWASPDDDPQVYQRYQQLFELRQSLPELATGDVQLENISCTNQHLFSGIRTRAGRSILGLVSFSSQRQKAVITLSSIMKTQSGRLPQLKDV